MKSANNPQSSIKITSGLIGNGKVAEILSKKSKIIVQSAKPKRVEERIIEALYHKFKSSNNKLTTKDVMSTFEIAFLAFAFTTQLDVRDVVVKNNVEPVSSYAGA